MAATRTARQAALSEFLRKLPPLTAALPEASSVGYSVSDPAEDPAWEAMAWDVLAMSLSNLTVARFLGLHREAASLTVYYEP